VDGLLLTRAERIRNYWAKTGLIVGPSAILALITLGLGLWVVAVFVSAIAGMVGVTAGSSLRTRRGAAIFGLCLAGAVFIFMIVAALVVSHPIQRGE
jgi:hypothetical protein